MTDGQFLFAVFAGLYILECVRLLPLHARLCRGRAEGRWRLQAPMRELGGRGRALLLLRPFPPLPAHFSTMPWPFVPRGDWLEVTDENGKKQQIGWAEIEPRADGGVLWLNRHVSVPLLSEEHARDSSRRLIEWQAMNAARRDEAFLRHAAETLDARKTGEMAAALAARTRALRSNGAWIFLWCFGVVAGIHAWYGETPRLWAALAGLSVMQLMQAVMFWRETRRESGIRQRFWKTLAIALLPQHSIRASDHFCRAAGNVSHPLAARELLQEEDFHALAARMWREARYRKGWQVADEPSPIEAAALLRFFKQEKIDVASLEAAPAHDGSSGGYCPRCHTLFQSNGGACSDCGGVDLKAF